MYFALLWFFTQSIETKVLASAYIVHPALLLPLPPPLRPNLLFPSPHPDSCSSNPFLGKLFHQTGAWFILSPLSNICTLLTFQVCPTLALRFKIANHHKDTLYPLLCCSFLCSPCHPLVCFLVFLYFFYVSSFSKIEVMYGWKFFFLPYLKGLK